VAPGLYAAALVTAALALPMSPASAQTDAQKEQADRNFVCPENLRDDATRDEALRAFLEQFRTSKDVTVAQVVQLRMALLEKHHCEQTLANIRNHSGAAPAQASH
jgi:CMP-N-acetylneuraminic acid synthetase